MADYTWIFNKTKCIGCRACQVSCKMENNVPPGLSYRWVVERWGGAYPNPTLTPTSMACFHCKDPACLKACPVDAITKNANGVVLIDADLCVGCRYCEWACPYGAPQFDELAGIMRKCTLCIQRLEQGLKPACVMTCVGEALDVVLDGPTGGTPPEGFADPKYTHPSVRFEE